MCKMIWGSPHSLHCPFMGSLLWESPALGSQWKFLLLICSVCMIFWVIPWIVRYESIPIPILKLFLARFVSCAKQTLLHFDTNWEGGCYTYTSLHFWKILALVLQSNPTHKTQCKFVFFLSCLSGEGESKQNPQEALVKFLEPVDCRREGASSSSSHIRDWNLQEYFPWCCWSYSKIVILYLFSVKVSMCAGMLWVLPVNCFVSFKLGGFWNLLSVIDCQSSKLWKHSKQAYCLESSRVYTIPDVGWTMASVAWNPCSLSQNYH